MVKATVSHSPNMSMVTSCSGSLVAEVLLLLDKHTCLFQNYLRSSVTSNIVHNHVRVLDHP